MKKIEAEHQAALEDFRRWIAFPFYCPKYHLSWLVVIWIYFSFIRELKSWSCADTIYLIRHTSVRDATLQMIFDKNLFPLRPGMTLNSGDVQGSKMWLQVGSRECVCACACVCVGGGGRGRGAWAPPSTLTTLMVRAVNNASYMKILLLATKKPLCLFFSSYNFVTWNLSKYSHLLEHRKILA